MSEEVEQPRSESTRRIEIVYPRGYRRIVSVEDSESTGSRKMDSGGDDQFIKLYEQYQSSGCDMDWKMIDEVIQCATRLIPDVNAFLNAQQDNRHLHGWNYDFLFYIVDFIYFGRCDVSPLAALELIDDAPKEGGIDRYRKTPHVGIPSSVTHRRVWPLQKWLEQEGGLENLINTLYVLFGPNHRIGR